jgi:hypothetical protein
MPRRFSLHSGEARASKIASSNAQVTESLNVLLIPKKLARRVLTKGREQR